ncbi:MAG: hypothetical protein GFH27_549285n302 [Chloroflexi bacterium AL-W]|nr:hypothetical protein [Chloroflexi bacterium AL-N1]NOK65814.1 hypothetical protein [Chloroflexi bacterium AL-N10]NOK74245.1 hypothetical protein [Chloroflexi bacterium AL-N5]NOK80847.1 hypothetical protein [Chloroflexi bacterium AL-W]NOK88503.1 hypothetical protein [Chloroflexi bacterium AL-N15]
MIIRPRFWVMVIITSLMFSYELFMRHADNRELRLGGVLSLTGSPLIALLIPITSGIVSSGSLAQDRRCGYTILVLARGISRQQYLVIKIFTTIIVSALATLFGILGFLLISSCIVPWGNTIVAPPQDGRWLPGPVPQLFSRNPLLNDLLCLAMLTVATSVLSLLGLFISTIVNNEYIAMVTPFTLTVGSVYLLRGSFEIVSPYSYLEVWNMYRNMVPLDMLFYAAFVYWFVVACVFCIGSLLIFIWRESI